MGTVLDNVNDTLQISLTTPYINLKRILSYSDSLDSNSIYYDLKKEFRFSYNNQNFSNWLELADSSLQRIKLTYGSEFWIEYKYTLLSIEDGETITFNNIQLEVVDFDEKIEIATCDVTNSNVECCDKSSVTITDCCTTDYFNPYDLSSAMNVLGQLNQMVANVFGFEVEYFKIDPNMESKDVVLNEYSIYNTKESCKIKILIPDNVIPSKEFLFNSIEGIALPELVEIHIVKSEFQAAFGEQVIPRDGDHLYFPYLNRRFTINSVMIADENPFNTSNYYRVNLSNYHDTAKVLDEDNLTGDLKEMSNSYEEVFGEEFKDEMKRVTKPQQYVDINANADKSDVIRSHIDEAIIIKEFDFRNDQNYTIVATHYYDFKNITLPTPVIKYKYDSGLNDVFAMTFITNMRKRLIVDSLNFKIRSFSNVTDTYTTDDYMYEGTIVETLVEHSFEDGDFISIKNSSYYNGVNRIEKIIDSNKFIINSEFKGNKGGTVNKKYEYQEIIKNNNQLSIYFLSGAICIKLKEELFTFNLSMILNKWVSHVLNFSNDFQQLALYVYNDKFEKVYSKTLEINEVVFEPEPIHIISGDYWLTNFRLFNKNIEEEEQIAVLNQNVVIDSHLALVIDNARPQIRLPRHNNTK